MARNNLQTKTSSRALEALLRNPVPFVQATSLTYDDQKKLAQPSIIEDVPQKCPGEQQICPLTRKRSFGRLQANPVLGTQAISGRWTGQASSHTPSRGFFNRHVMCYRNSTIQALLHAPKLVNWLSDHHPNCARDSRCTACAMKQLFVQYWNTSIAAKEVNQKMNQLEGNLRSTSAFANWSWARQQDANEYYLHLINSMIERHPR